MTDATRVPQHTYEIRAPDGTLEALHVRKDLPLGRKDFSWQLPNGIKGLGGRAAKTLPLYRSETIRALKSGALVIVTEGEKAADGAVALGFDAVGTVTGSSGLPADAVLRTLDGFHVVAWPDADVVGTKHMDRLLAALARLRGGVGDGLSRVDPAALGLTGTGDDAADWTPTDDAEDEVFFAMRPWVPPDTGPASPIRLTTSPRCRRMTRRSRGRPSDPRGGQDAGRVDQGAGVGGDRRAVQRALGPDGAAGRHRGAGRAAELGDLGRFAGREAPRDDCGYLPLSLGRKGVPSRLQFGRERWGDVLDAILDDRRVDPFKIWLDALPQWDGEDRIDFWLGHIFAVGDIPDESAQLGGAVGA